MRRIARQHAAHDPASDRRRRQFAQRPRFARHQHRHPVLVHADCEAHPVERQQRRRLGHVVAQGRPRLGGGAEDRRHATELGRHGVRGTQLGA
ncbi:MAG: hypothetical protein MUC69_03510 [Gemmatimonadales bacterium]|nr:hypothetical protein [Gemmatimonadales bacterium]